MGIKVSRFGKTKDGKEVSIFTLMNGNGMGIEVTNYGATLVAVTTQDRNGRFDDVVLGYDDVTDYMDNDGYFGATIGRNGNRIGGAQVTINGTVYEIDKNEKGNNLHSGFQGFDKVLWDAEMLTDETGMRFSYHSPDMDQGFPGNFDVTVTYTLTEDNEVKIHYQGEADKDTIANLTNHTYFNLAGQGKGAILDHQMWIDADAFTVIDEESIPTGELRAVKGTPMDFMEPKVIGNDIDADYEQLRVAGGYDHNFVLNNQDGTIRKCAVVSEDTTGRVLEVFSDCIGIQFYTGNYITKRSGKDGEMYDKCGGFCLETQFYPDHNHHENFPSAVLKAGDQYETTTIYKFSVRK